MPEGAGSFGGVFLHGDQLDKVVYAQASANASHSSRGQSVIGSGDVIAHGLRRPAADKHRACILHPIEIGSCIHGEVFGSDAIRDGARFAESGGDDDEAVAREGFAGNRIVAAALLCFRHHCHGEIGARGDEDGECFGVVLSLRNKVGSDVSCAAVLTDYHDLCGPGEHVDGAIEGYQTLGGSDVQIAGTDDFVDTGDCRGAVRERGYGMCAAEPIELWDPGLTDEVRVLGIVAANSIELGHCEQMRGSECLLRRLRRDYNNSLDARDERRNHSHEQRGWQRVPSTGNIAADASKRTRELAGRQAFDRGFPPRGWHLPMGKNTNLRRRRNQSSFETPVDSIPGGGHLSLRDAEGSYVFEPVEFGYVSEKRPITLLAHIADNALHGGEDGVEGRAAAFTPRSGAKSIAPAIQTYFIPTQSLTPANVRLIAAGFFSANLDYYVILILFSAIVLGLATHAAVKAHGNRS